MAGTLKGPALWLSMFRTTEAVDRVVRQSMEVADLGSSEFMMLEPLLHLGPLTPSALADKTCLTSGSVTAALDRLERRGLVERGVNPRDQRSRIVSITEPGRALIEPVYAEHAAQIERLFSAALTAEQRRELFDLLSAVRKSAKEMEA
jgi:MarR family 2-MHQ and catechol resistance regulon transcriptional repressor